MADPPGRLSGWRGFSDESRCAESPKDRVVDPERFSRAGVDAGAGCEVEVRCVFSPWRSTKPSRWARHVGELLDGVGRPSEWM